MTDFFYTCKIQTYENKLEMKKNPKKIIIKTLKEKTLMKQKVYNNTFNVLKMLKKTLRDLAEEYNKEFEQASKPFEFRNRNRFEAEMRIQSDLLIFNMQTNIFEFHRSHGVWKTSYVQNNTMTSYTGIINIYNFLADSLKLNRKNDVGYLIGRIFVNKDNHYFVEGKRQLGFLYNDFVNAVINKEEVKKIVTSTIMYCLDFDLLVPPYDDIKAISVGQFQEKMSDAQVKIGKRLGFKFYADNDKV